MKRTDHSEAQGIDRIILKWILGISIGKYGMDTPVSAQEPVAGWCKYGNKFSGSMFKTGISWLADYYQLLKDSAIWT